LEIGEARYQSHSVSRYKTKSGQADKTSSGSHAIGSALAKKEVRLVKGKDS